MPNGSPMATNYGITEQGFTLKHLPDILNDQYQQATDLFQDLVLPGEVVDTSTSSALGRLIALDAPGDADLWEAAQLCYSAFDPNSATGVALDNLVSYAGISRNPASFTKADCVFTGSFNTIIPVNSNVTSITGGSFNLQSQLTLDATSVVKAVIDVISIANLTAYTITYTQNTVPINITYTSSVAATKVEILSGLAALVNGSHPSFTAEVVSSNLVITRVNVFNTTDLITTPNMVILKVSKLGVVIANQVGQLEQQADTIVNIATPVLGWDSVTNPTEAVSGTFQETDEELRIRFRNSKFERATGNYESIVSAIESAQGVEYQVLYENDTSVTDSRGLPPHSFLLIVEGGLESDIANLIWKNKPVGIYSGGNTSVTIQDTNGYPQVVRFSRPVGVNVQIVIDLTKYQNYPADGDDQIKKEIIDYIDTLRIGEQLTYSRLYTPINTVVGHQIEGVQIGVVGGPLGTANIVPTFDGIVRVTSDNITII